MKFITQLVTVSIVILVSACASSGNNNNSASTPAASNDGKICKMEKKTGSNVRKKVCRTPEQIELARSTAKELAQRGVFKANSAVNEVVY